MTYEHNFEHLPKQHDSKVYTTNCLKSISFNPLSDAMGRQNLCCFNEHGPRA